MSSTRACTSGVLGALHTMLSADFIGAVPELNSIIPAEIDVAGLFGTNIPTIVVAVTGMHLIFEATSAYLRQMDEADETLLKELARR